MKRSTDAEDLRVRLSGCRAMTDSIRHPLASQSVSKQQLLLPEIRVSHERDPIVSAVPAPVCRDEGYPSKFRFSPCPKLRKARVMAQGSFRR